MSDDKRFDATPARRERALSEGNVPRSAELSGIAAFAAAAAATCAVVPVASAAAAAVVGRTPAVGATATIAALALAPAAAAACAGTAAALLQGGGVRLVAPSIDPRRLAPAAGLKRMFGAEAVVATARASLALLAALAAVAPLGYRAVVAAAATAGPRAAGTLVADAFVRACLAVTFAGAAFAVADHALVRRRWAAGIRMSHEERKRDARENEGDPQAKSRRKQLHRSILRGALARTREASFVVVNPTHVAVAVLYAPPRVAVPEILVRAAGEAALRVREIARAHGVPLVENVALARLLFSSGTCGKPIPAPTFVAVAQIVAALAREGLLG